MEKRESSGQPAKSETTPAPYAPPELPEKTRARRAAALIVAGGVGLVGLLWVNTLIGAVVAALVLASFVAYRLARKGVSDGAGGALPGFPPGVSEEDFRSLKKDINRLRFEKGIEDRGERAHDQLLQSAERFKRFTRLLSGKFNEGEITYSRYHAAGTQVYLAILDNLRAAASILGAVGAINADYAEKRMKNPENGNAAEQEIRALEERLQNKERQLARVQDILSANETALTAFDKMNEAITAVKTSAGWSGRELEETLKELERLAERAPKYSI